MSAQVVARRRKRRFSYEASMAALLALCFLALATAGTAHSTFSADTTNPSNSWQANTLTAPSSFTANRTCVGPAYRASSTNSTSSATSLVLNTPATGTKDYLILSVVTYGATTPANVATPSGWTNLGANTGDGSATKVTLTVFARPSPATPPADYTVTFSAGTAAVAALTSYSNSGSVQRWTGNYGTTSTATATGMSTSERNQLVLAVFGHTDTTSTTPSGMTSSATINGTTAGLHQYHELIVPSNTAVSDKSSAISPTNPAWSSFFIVLGPSYDTTVDLDWTATPDTWSSGYEISRSPGSTNAVSGRSTVSFADTTTSGATDYTYTIASAANAWRSPTRTVAVAEC